MNGLFGNLVTLLILLALVLGFLYLARRAWGSKNAILKWVGVVVSVLLALLLGLIFVLGAVGLYQFHVPRPNPVHEVKVEITPERVARGEKLANFCAGCHSTTHKPPLDGSAVDFGNQPGTPPLGSLTPPNLTPAGPLQNWTDGEIIRAIREGVHKDGRTLMIMPAESFHYASDEDVQSLVAYLRSQAPVQHNVPEIQPNLIALIILAVGAYPPSVQPPITQPIIAPPQGETPAYGEYLVNISDCRVCHGADLASGTTRAFTPNGPNLTLIVPNWTREQFIQTIRTGVDPTGHKLDPNQMIWRELSATYDDDELAAMYQYIRSLPPVVINK